MIPYVLPGGYLIRKSTGLHDVIIQSVGCKSQQILGGKAGRDHRKDLIDHLVQCQQVRLLSLFRRLLQDDPLALRPLEVHALGIPDSGIGHRVHAVHLLGPILYLDIFPVLSSHFRSFHRILVAPVGLFRGHIQFQAAKQVNGIHQRGKVHADIIVDVQIKIPIQKADRLFRTSPVISRIGLLICSVFLLKQGIPVDGGQCHIARIIVDACNHNTVALYPAVQFVVSGIQAEQGDIRIRPGIFICLQVLVIQDIKIQLIQFEYSVGRHA